MPQLAINKYNAMATFHNDDFCETHLSILCTGSEELSQLTTENCSR